MTRRIDFNRIDDQDSLNGWRLSDVIRELAGDAASQFMTCGCPEPQVCIHAAAANLYGIFKIVEHPDDCEDCQKLNRS